MAGEKNYWNEEAETMPLDRQKRLQEKRLQELVTHAYERSAFYRRKYDQAGVKPGDIKTLDDLRKLPVIDDSEMRQTPMEEKLAVPWEEIKHFCSTSGTTAFPELHAFTKSDFYIGCVDNECRLKWCAGLRPGDVIQNLLLPFSCQSIIDANLGATEIMQHVGRGNLDHQVLLANKAKVTVIEHFPSLVLRYFDRAKELGINIKESPLRLVIGAGEGWAESYRKRIEAEYGVIFHQLYGMSEVAEFASECEYRGGMHILADTCIVEVVDPETLEVLGTGEYGEVVVTNFFRKAVPRIRYRTKDIACLLPYEPCPCGRTLPKLSMIKGRMSQLINVKDKRFFPVDVEEVLGGISDLGNEYQIIRDKPELDRLMVKVEHKPKGKDLRTLANHVEEALYDRLGVESKVELVPPGSIGHPLVKAMRVITTYEKT